MDGWKRTDTAIFESTLNPETRRAGGMHYTSIENIHKVIDPLFLDDYRAQFAAAMQEKQPKRRIERLKALQEELGRGRYFDPACGSGNFLTESFLSLRRLENDILRELQKESDIGLLQLNFVTIDQFYGIEINDFAVAVCKTALWIAEAQMLAETEEIVQRNIDFLPLHANNNIHEGNALRMEWKDVVAPGDNVKIMGNPPFVGARLMDAKQKEDLKETFRIPLRFDGSWRLDGTQQVGKWKNVGNLDYVTGWYKKAADYMKGTSVHTAFVSTNSITQGEQVPVLWKPLFDNGLQFDFAYRTFRWDSEAESKAHVHCVILGFSYVGRDDRFIDSGGIRTPVEHINAYLMNGEDVFIENRSEPISQGIPPARSGNKPIDDGNYLFTVEEMKAFVKTEPASKPYFRPWYGSYEFINRKPRYCLWLGECPPKALIQMPHCMERVKAVQAFRQASKSAGTRKIADRPTHFHVETIYDKPFLVLPLTSSQNRRYVPIGFMAANVLASNLVITVQDATLYNFGVLTSNVFMSWMRAVAGRLKSDYRITKDNVYNTFPWPSPTSEQQAKIEQTAQAILDARDKYPESTFADMYGEGMVLYPELMEAHRKNDRAVMEAYGFWGKFNDEASCVAALMQMYQQLVESS